jgi:hypothetical protein
MAKLIFNKIRDIINLKYLDKINFRLIFHDRVFYTIHGTLTTYVIKEISGVTTSLKTGYGYWVY